MENPYQKYKNSDSRCTYPFTPDPVGYCWAYACHVDGDVKFADMEQVCPGCEFWPPYTQDNSLPALSGKESPDKQ